MKIEKNKVVEVSYELTVEGQVVDTATKEQPLDYIHGTKMLTRLETLIKTFSRHTSPFAATAATALFTTMVSCNQTLAIILTEELCRPLPKSREAMALYLGNTAVVMVPLIPWSIACVFVLDSVGAPRTSILFACYLYFLPLWGLYRPDFGMHG